MIDFIIRTAVILLAVPALPQIVRNMKEFILLMSDRDLYE